MHSVPCRCADARGRGYDSKISQTLSFKIRNRTQWKVPTTFLLTCRFMFSGRMGGCFPACLATHVDQRFAKRGPGLDGAQATPLVADTQVFGGEVCAVLLTTCGLLVDGGGSVVIVVSLLPFLLMHPLLCVILHFCRCCNGINTKYSRDAF